jgi:hypothetical protein
MALFGHGAMSELSLLTGVVQTSHFKGVRTVFDRDRTLHRATNPNGLIRTGYPI